MRKKQFLRLLQSGNRLFVSYRREIIEELRQRMSAFEIVDESSERDARSDEDGRAT
jgi:hypothetical protein